MTFEDWDFEPPYPGDAFWALTQLQYVMAMDRCPFNQGAGACASGCRTEPACHTQAPRADGWVTEVRRAATSTAAEARAEARDARRRGDWWAVKPLIDLARWADRVALS